MIHHVDMKKTTPHAYIGTAALNVYGKMKVLRASDSHFVSIYHPGCIESRFSLSSKKEKKK